MYAIKFDLVLLMIFDLMISHVSYCQRRIEGGINVTTHKRYVVYLVKATLSSRNYDYWLCGGALVTSNFIITSAACVEDVNYLYAIAGYNKYVTDEEIESDNCTKYMKKKVVFTCVPVSYNFDFDVLEKWAYIDIALVKVESPYDFNDTKYETMCTYKPTVIPINYEPKYQMANTDSMVLGWGHASLWRKHGDFENYNSEMLQYTPTLIMDKRECMSEYQVYPNMTYIIEQYMICSLLEGNINDQGRPIEKAEPTAEGCLLPNSSNPLSLSPVGRMGQGLKCEEPNSGIQNTYYPNTRRDTGEKNITYRHYTPYDFIKKAAHEKISNITRKNGICQNDHGGPLVTWVGSREILIGIASVFKINEYNDCMGPYLYTSTQCNGAFIDCVLSNEESIGKKKKNRRMELCDSPPSVRGFDMVQNHISWKNHPAGPADNEKKLVTNGPKKNAAPQGNFARYENMPLNDQSRGNQQYAATIAPFRGNPQYAPNGPYAARQPYPPNAPFTPRLPYPPNAPFTARQPYLPNAPFTARQPYSPNEQFIARQPYSPKEQFIASQQYVPNGHFVAHQQYAGNDQYVRNGNTPQFEGHPENYVQPQERYQGSKKFARLGEYSVRPQLPIYKPG